jgi:hypothetical protein
MQHFKDGNALIFWAAEAGGDNAAYDFLDDGGDGVYCHGKNGERHVANIAAPALRCHDSNLQHS